MDMRHSNASAQEDTDTSGNNPLGIIRLLRATANALVTQLELYGQLARIEWEQEKNRMMRMLAIALLGFACLLCFLLFMGILAITVTWATDYRIATIIAFMALYALGFASAWYQVKRLAARGSETFAATREEMTADLALIKSKL